MERYENFDIEIRSGEEGYVVHVRSPLEQVTAPFRVPLDEQELRIMGLTVARGRRTRSSASRREVDEIKAFGGRLFDGLFTGDVLAAYQRSLTELRREREAGLRVRLRLAGVPELAQIPWEYLYDAPNRRFLALEDETPVVRYLDLPLPAGPLEVEPPLEVLVLISSPSDVAALDVDEEWTRLNQAVEDLVRAGHLRLHRLDRATVPALRWTLKEGDFHVVHFIGHGGVDRVTAHGILIFENEDGLSDEVEAEAVAGILSAERTLRLAVLNACEGGRASAGDIYAGTAQTLVQRDVPAVIAMQFEISDEAAIALTHDFYKALAYGDPVDAALTEARRGLRWELRNELEWGTPVLYTRAHDGRLFSVGGRATPPEPGTLPPPTPPEVAAQEAGSRGADPGLARRVAELLHQSQLAVYAERWGEAAARLEEVLDLSPGHTEARTRLETVRRREQLATLFRTGEEHQRDGRLDAALDAFRRVQAIDAEHRSVGDRIRTIEEERRRQREIRTRASQATLAGSPGAAATKRSWTPWAVGGTVVVLGLAWLGGALAPEADLMDPGFDPYDPVEEWLPPEDPDPYDVEGGAADPSRDVGGGYAPGEPAAPAERWTPPPARNRDGEAAGLGLVPVGMAFTGTLAAGREEVHEISLPPGSFIIAGSCGGACGDLDLDVREMGQVVAFNNAYDAEPWFPVGVIVPGTYQLHVNMYDCADPVCSYRVQAYTSY